MEFPISKERLQNFRSSEAAKIAQKHRVDSIVKTICSEIENTVLKTGAFQYVYKLGEGYVAPGSIYVSLLNMGGNSWHNTKTGQFELLSLVPTLPIKEEILEKLRILLPDSKIVLDPLETYILIDWS